MLTVHSTLSISSPVCRPLSWPACPAALNREGSATGTDDNSCFSRVVQSKRKALVKQVSTRNIQWQDQLHWAISGCSWQVKHLKYLLSIHPITQPGSATHHQLWALRNPSWPVKKVAVKEEAPQAVLTGVVGGRSSKGEILRAGVPIVRGKENNRNDGTSRNDVFYVQPYPF